MSMQGISETAAGDHRSRMLAMAAGNRLGVDRARRGRRWFLHRRRHDAVAPAAVDLAPAPVDIDLRGLLPVAENACWAAGVGR